MYKANEGTEFVGEFNFNTKCGTGEIYYNDETKYVGEWSGFSKHGQGTLYSSDGNILKSGTWERDQFRDKK